MSATGPYIVQFDPKALKELTKLDKPAARRIATVTSNSIALTWTNPPDADFAGLWIRCADDPTPPATETSGTWGTGTAKAVTSYTDTGLTRSPVPR